jgi:imidazolonepropionase-like amidohydrolase
MTLPPLALAAAAALLAIAPDAHAQRTVIRAARMLDVRDGQLIRDAVVVVEGGRIRSIGGAITPAPGDSVIVLENHTLLPGFIDGHVHLAIGGQPRANALADLRAGFTTIVDLGARTPRLARIKDSINAGHIEGPRVLAAGLWIGRQGGVCEFNGLGIAGGVDAYRARVRENVENGAEVIKACVSGWPADAFARPNDYELPDSVLHAIVEPRSRRCARVECS